MVDTLVIGLGGTGSYVVNKFAERIRGRRTQDIVKTICVDTHVDDLNACRNIDRRVQLREPPRGRINLDEVAKRVGWYPFESWRGVVGGVGRIRPTSRFLLVEVPQNYTYQYKECYSHCCIRDATVPCKSRCWRYECLDNNKCRWRNR